MGYKSHEKEASNDWKVLSVLTLFHIRPKLAQTLSEPMSGIWKLPQLAGLLFLYLESNISCNPIPS